MATEKQIRANRENAKRSTGPKTAAGRIKSSRNALRHGLSLELHIDKDTTSRIAAIAPILVSDPADAMKLLAAFETAHAQLDLARIRSVRNQMMTELERAPGNLMKLRRLAALDRYERLALAKRRRASDVLAPKQPKR
jgi:hypothetical protein